MTDGAAYVARMAIELRGYRVEEYSCSACSDPEQGCQNDVRLSVYDAKDNVPKYAHLCQRHYERSSEELRAHYARVKP
jgi:hypothetical protein